MQISYVNVFVTDLEKATEFYRDKLGLPLQFSSPEAWLRVFRGRECSTRACVAGDRPR